MPATAIGDPDRIAKRKRVPEHNQKGLQMFLPEEGKEIARRGYVRASSGNMSVRDPMETMLVTKSGAWLETLTPDDLLRIDLESGKLVGWMQGKPSMETDIHRGILNLRPEINYVLHYQAPWATAFCCIPDCEKYDLEIIPEIRAYCAPIRYVLPFRPGSPELTEAVLEYAPDSNMIMLKNHGQIALAENFRQLIQRIEFLELACSIIIQTRGFTRG